MKDSFLMYLSFEELLMRLTPDELRRMMLAIFRYHGGAIEPDFSDNRVLEMCWQPLKTQFERDAQKYANICQRNKENGKNGGRPPVTQENPTEPKKPSGFSRNPKEPKKPDTDTDTDTDTECSKEHANTARQPAREGYPVSVDDVLKISKSPTCGVIMSRESADRYFTTRMASDWIDAKGRRIEPKSLVWDIKKWVMNEQGRGATQPPAPAQADPAKMERLKKEVEEEYRRNGVV